MRVRADAVVIVVGLLVVGLLGYAQKQAEQRPNPSVYSTYDTGRNGYRALYAVLRSAGVRAQRFEHATGQLDAGSIGTLVIAAYEYDPSAKWLDDADAKVLRSFVERGGRLVAIDDRFAGKQDVTPGVPTSTLVRSNEAVAAPGAGLKGVERVQAPLTAVFSRKEAAKKTPLLANAKGVVALAYRLGKGEVVAIAAPALFSNAYLQNADNAAFAYAVLAGHGTVAFDEYVHGYDDDASFWSVLPGPVRAAFWIVCAIVLLALIGANVPFAPPLDVRPRQERDSSDYLTAMARLMQRARVKEQT